MQKTTEDWTHETAAIWTWKTPAGHP